MNLNCFVAALMLTAGSAGWAQAPAEKWGTQITFLDPVEPTVTQSLCEDGKGRLWAIVLDKKRDKWLVRMSNEEWLPVGVLFNTAAAKATSSSHLPETQPMPVREVELVAPGPDGSVLAHSHEYTILQVRGDQYRWVDVNGQRKVYEDGQGRPWLMMAEPGALLIEGAAKAKEPLYVLDEKEYILDNIRFAMEIDNVYCIPLLKDRLDRYWYTHRAIDLHARQAVDYLTIFDKNYSQRPALSNVQRVPMAVYDGKTVHLLEGEDPTYGWEQNYVNFIAPKDENTLWLGTSGHGLFEIDIQTLKTTMVPLFGNEIKGNVPSILFAHGKWYAVGQEHLGYGLYRLDEDGPQLIVGQLDGEKSPFAFDFGAHRPVLATEAGLWIGSDNRGGVMFVPKDASPPVRLDWRRGFGIQSVHFLYQLAPGRLMMAGPGTWDCAVKETELLALSERPTRAELLPRNPVPLLQDLYGDVWQVEKFSEQLKYNLKRWETRGWRVFALPVENMPAMQAMPLFACDSKGRIWVTFEDGPTAILSPPPPDTAQEGAWIHYASYVDAVDSEYTDGMLIKQTSDRSLVSQFDILKGARNTLAFSTRHYVYYFDGGAWLNWTVSQITNKKDRQKADQTFFNEAGDLFYYSQQAGLYKLCDKQWHSAPEDQAGCNMRRMPASKVLTRPEYAPEDLICVDYQGLTWLQRGGQLYRAGYGLCLPVIKKDENTPLIQGGKVTSVLPDKRGNIFVATDAAQWILLHPLAPPPQTQISVEQPSSDGAVIRERPSSDGKLWFTWRSDSGEWQNASESPVTITGLEAGEHQIEVRAIDEQFQIAPVSEVVKVVISPNESVLSLLVQDLSSPDYTVRETAAAALREKGPLAVSALQKARETATLETKWWIDSILASITGSTK